jgi:hypothetical protein
MAKPVKTGDAESWVYSRNEGQDCQTDRKANPVKTGGAKLWA